MQQSSHRRPRACQQQKHAAVSTSPHLSPGGPSASSVQLHPSTGTLISPEPWWPLCKLSAAASQYRYPHDTNSCQVSVNFDPDSHPSLLLVSDNFSKFRGEYSTKMIPKQSAPKPPTSPNLQLDVATSTLTSHIQRYIVVLAAIEERRAEPSG